MRNVKLASGYIKVERTPEEKTKSYSVSDEFLNEIVTEVSSPGIANAIVKSIKIAKEKSE